MGVFADLNRRVRNRAVRSGERVRLVRMDGCMANARVVEHEGEVLGIKLKKAYGDTVIRPYAVIRLDNGDIVDRCAEPADWVRYEGVMEYRS